MLNRLITPSSSDQASVLVRLHRRNREQQELVEAPGETLTVAYSSLLTTY